MGVGVAAPMRRDHPVGGVQSPLALNFSPSLMVGAVNTASQHTAVSVLWSWTVTGAVSGRFGVARFTPRPFTWIFAWVSTSPSFNCRLCKPSGVKSPSLYL